MLNVINEIDEDVSDDDKYSDSDCDDAENKIQYVQFKSPEKNEAAFLAHKLLRDFNVLGICEAPPEFNSKDDLFMNVIINSFNLVNNYRKVITETRSNTLTIMRLKDDITRLEKKTDALKQKIDEKDNLIESINKKAVLKNIECEDLQKEIVRLQKELASYKRLLSLKENEWEHKIKQLQTKNDDLKGIAEKISGSYTSKDLITANVIQKYKMNEESYKTIIKKLQDNNQGLIKHLTTLMQNEHTSS